MKFFLLVLLVPIFVFSSCAKNYKKVASVAEYSVPLYICMPQNKHVLFNISPLLYASFYNHFESIGYCMQDNLRAGNMLKIQVQEFEGAEKFISPDFLTYGSRLWLVIFAELYDCNGVLIAAQTFNQPSIFLRPREAVYNSSYLEFVTNKMLMLLSVRVEHYFRNFMLPKKL